MKKFGKACWLVVKLYTIATVLAWAFIGTSECARYSTINPGTKSTRECIRISAGMFNRAHKRWKEYFES